MSEAEAEMMGRNVGQVLGWVGLILLGFFVSRQLTKRRDDGKPVRWPIFVAIFLAVVPLINRCQGNGTTQSQMRLLVQPQDVSGSADPAIRVTTFSEPANGFTQRDFTPEFLGLLNDSQWQGYIESLNGGKPAENFEFVPKYLEFTNQRLAVIQIQLNNTMIGAQIFGLVGENIVRVSCLDRKGMRIMLGEGVCGRKIKETFGVEIY